jgi:molybdate transport system permease protein
MALPGFSSALGLTLRLAGLTTLSLLLLATPLAAWLAGGHSLPRRVVQAAVALPLLLPPTVLGFYLLVGLGPTTALGRALIALLGHPLAFTFGGLLVGSMIYSLPFAVQPLVVAFAGIDPGLRDTAAVLGASPWQVFRRITLPLARMSFLTAAVLTFAHTVGEFGSIFDQVQEFNYAAANRTAILLVALSFLALLIVYAKPQRPRLV